MNPLNTKKLVLLFIIVVSSTFSKAQTLLHYWNFNVITDEPAHLTATNSIISGAGIQHIPSGVPDPNNSEIEVAGGTGNGFALLNARGSGPDPAGNHLRLNNPIGATLIFSLPTTGYENVVLKYVTRRSGQGAGTQIIEYSTGGSYISFTTINPINGNPNAIEELDFSAISAADNNPDFKIKITFIQGPGGVEGNNRFDNVTLEGFTFGTGDNVAPVATFSPLNGATNVAVNTNPTISFNEAIRLVNNTAIDNSNVDALIVFKQTNASGTDVSFDAMISGNIITITPTSVLSNNQVYYLALKDNVIEDGSENAITSVQSVTFTTIAVQTVFQPGDIIPIAYRTNATGTPDEVSFLTLVDILPGTLINFTDAKYTDNIPAQCAGGLTWTSPASCIPSGTVIRIQTENSGWTNIGTLSGSGYGLSSNGEQVIVYTGTNTSPSFITALSTNAWVTGAHTICNNSLSKIPVTLADGTSSFNGSTIPGNVSANTVNAYYNGTMTGTSSALRTSILNPANWVGIGGSTPPQTWPTWNFPGPPAVTGFKVVNATTLKIGFSRDMESTSVTNLTNYTGIANLTSATQTSNGTAADTITLTFSTPFTNGNSYTLNISGVQDTDNRTMSCNYSNTFDYNTTIAFNENFITIAENGGSVNVVLNIEFPATASVDLVLKGAPYSTASASDLTYTNTTISLSGSTTTQTINIPITNDNTEEQDEYFVLYLESASGVAITGDPYITVHIIDNDRTAPVATQTIELNYVTSYDPSAGESTTEIVVHDPTTQRLFAISAIEKRLDIINFSNPASPSLITSVDMTPYGGITSVAVKNGIVAVASPNANEQLDGSVVFFNTNGVFQKQVTVGALPDMITFSPDGMKVLTANEGQPNSAYTVDPEGTVSVIDISGGISGLTQGNVTTINFTSFNATESTLIAAGVRKLKTSSTLSQDFEPEYITISGTTAWVTLQENNAIAEINLSTNTVTSIWAMGAKDWSLDGNGIDASDNNDVVLLSNWPVKSFYIPDGVANYSVGGVTYLVTANEGDEKEYAGLNERTTIGAAGTILDPTVYPNANVLKESYNIGRLRITNRNGDTDNDGDYDQLYTNGTRSFSIWNANTHARVYDSGDDFERITSTDPSVSAIFNCDNEDNDFKGRSHAKGPEPEGLTVATIAGKVYAFVTLERIGGVMVYDITDPSAPIYVDYKNSRSLVTYTGDHGPEGIIYISGTNSPDSKHYIVVANELSGTLSVYEVTGTLSTGVENAQNTAKEFNVFPNPAQDILYMNISSAYEILDITGKVVLSGTETSSINVSTLDRGIYLLRAANGEVRKFLAE